MNSGICAIILAAGLSKRMGQPKQLMTLDGTYLIEKVIRNVIIENFDTIVVVIGHQSDEIKKLISLKDPRLVWVENKNYLSGQSSSLREGLKVAIENHSAAMVFLGDVPFIKSSTVKRVWQTGIEIQENVSHSFLLQPTYQKIPGHPVFIGRISTQILDHFEGDKSLKWLKKAIKYHQTLPIDDRGIVFDIDTPAAYTSALKFIKETKLFK